jgi:hypothetical protein
VRSLHVDRSASSKIEKQFIQKLFGC